MTLREGLGLAVLVLGALNGLFRLMRYVRRGH